MDYKIYHHNSSRIFLIGISIILIGLFFVFANAKYDLIFDGLALLVFFLTTVGGMVFTFYWNDGIKDYKIDNKGIYLNNKFINWTDIKSYKFNDENPSIESLKIKTLTNKYYVAHKTKFGDKDDFRKFLKDFEKKINLLNEQKHTNIIKEPSVWDTKKGKRYAYVLIAIWIAFCIMIFFNFNLKSITYFLIFTGGALPMVMRALKSRN